MKYRAVNDRIIFENLRDLDLERTFNCGQCFRWDRFRDGYTGFAGRYPCFVKKEGDALLARALCGGDPGLFRERIAGYFALDVDYTALKDRFCLDPVMKKAVDYAPGIRVLNQPFFETLLTFIISRNNNIPRIKKIVDAMAEKYGEKKGGLYAFPTAERLRGVSREEFALLKMGFRARYVQDAVEKVLRGRISREEIAGMDSRRAEKYLMTVKGVGPKVADCILLFSCRKYDCFPKDVWINRALGQMFPRGLPRCVKGAEGIAQQYIFQFARFNLEK